MSYKNLWQGRVDAEDGEGGLRWHQVIEFDDAQHSNTYTTLIGYPNDLGIEANKGRVGASGGPNAMRQFLANLPWHMSGGLKDVGDAQIFEALPHTQADYAKKVSNALQNNERVLGLGGGHDIAWASYSGLVNTTTKRVGIINFDAHLDLRNPAPAPSSGTPFRQVAEQCFANGGKFNYACLGVSKAANTKALFDYAAFTETRMLFDVEFNLQKAKDTVIAMLAEIDELYVTVCMDAFPVSLCPGVSAPSALGICPNETIKIIQWLGQICKEYDVSWRVSDIAELNPSLDTDNKTARFAARIAFELVSAMQ